METVILPVNLRSFSPEWSGRPQYQFRSLLNEIDALHRPWYTAWKMPLSISGVASDSAADQRSFEELPVFRGRNQVGIVRDFCGPQFRQPNVDKTRAKFILHYMQLIDDRHPRLTALMEVAETCQECRDSLCVLHHSD